MFTILKVSIYILDEAVNR